MLYDAVKPVRAKTGMGSATHSCSTGGQKQSAEKKDQARSYAETYQFIHLSDLLL